MKDPCSAAGFEIAHVGLWETAKAVVSSSVGESEASSAFRYPAALAVIAEAAGRLLADDTVRRRCSEVAAEIATHAGLDEAVELISGPPT